MAHHHRPDAQRANRQLDLNGQSKSLRPHGQKALNALLDNMEADKPRRDQGMFVAR